MCGSDVDALRDFLGGLSLRSRYQRFFTGAPSMSVPMLRLLAGAGDNIDVVVACDAAVSGEVASAPGTGGVATIIGHAMAVDSLAPRAGKRTEIGVVVADARQGEGVGSALVRALADRARNRGIRRLDMDVLAENRRVLAMIARRWPGARYERRAAYVTVRATVP